MWTVALLKVCGKTTGNMVKVKKSGQMEPVSKDSFGMDSKMAKGHFYGLIKVNMSVNFLTTIFTDRGPTLGKMNAPSPGSG